MKAIMFAQNVISIDLRSLPSKMVNQLKVRFSVQNVATNSNWNSSSKRHYLCVGLQPIDTTTLLDTL